MSTKLTRVAKAADALLYRRLQLYNRSDVANVLVQYFLCSHQLLVTMSLTLSINHIPNLDATNIFWIQVTHSVSHYLLLCQSCQSQIKV